MMYPDDHDDPSLVPVILMALLAIFTWLAVHR